MEKFSCGELKTEKVKFFTQSSTKKFCSSVFNVGGCLASCLTFRPFLTLATWLLIKKNVYCTRHRAITSNYETSKL